MLISLSDLILVFRGFLLVDFLLYFNEVGQGLAYIES